MSEISRRNALGVATALGGLAVLGGAAHAAEGGGEGPKPINLNPKDYSKEQLDELKAIKSTTDLCKAWATVKPILVAAQGVLKLFYPPGAKAIELVIAFVEAVCGKKAR